ncbi:MAG TPA: PhnD/SsuA/transferrin family substrate-binding protein, partial [Thermodesulfobacteriota bacterium]|nr:PhnD/SsuA/transferrin family substrate-binding protein [Thermodesulfobacteriota bacterium]
GRARRGPPPAPCAGRAPGREQGGAAIRIQLSLACGDSDLNRALVSGLVQPAGIELVGLTMPSPERHRRMLVYEEFDVCEFSLATYLLAREAGRPFAAIPAFPHRRFRHSYVFCRTDAGIESPADLAGKRVGLDTVQNTAGLWVRGTLQDVYGLRLASVQWWTQEAEDLPLARPEILAARRVPAGTDLDTLLVRGELDAVIYPEILPSFAKGEPRVRRLFRDPKGAEQAYYRQTGIFPIMHTVVIHRRVLDRHPWVAVNLLEAFRASKAHAYRQLDDPRRFALAWVRDLVEEERALLGPDPWAYTVADNRHALETVIRYAVEQGLLARAPRVEELFVPSTLEALPRYL